MTFLPTIDLTPQVRLMLARGVLVLQPGQWVRGERGVGRYLRTDPRTGTTYVSWVRPGDSLETAAARFHRACRNAYVGRYRHLYDRVRAEQLARITGLAADAGLVHEAHSAATDQGAASASPSSPSIRPTSSTLGRGR